MCFVSVITQHYVDKWQPRVPQEPFYPNTLPNTTTIPNQSQELDRLLRPQPAPITPDELAEFRTLLNKAREYDKRNNEPHCEQAEKIALLKAIAKALDVDISFIEEE